MVVRRWIGPERERVLLRRVSQVVEDRPGLDAPEGGVGIHREHTVHVFREIDAHGRVAALTGQARAATAPEYGCAMLATHGKRANDIVHIARNDYADRRKPVVRAISGIQRAASTIEPDFTADDASQVHCQTIGVR
jgi:hypothetical protein